VEIASADGKVKEVVCRMLLNGHHLGQLPQHVVV